MFNLEESIAGWRRNLAADGLKARALLDELESHLREDVDRQVQSGIAAEEAFQGAVDHLGQPEVLRGEFSKIGETSDVFSRLKYFLQTLAGIQTPMLATNMNSSYSNPEPRWATYLKSAGFVLPAITLWMAMVIFIVPKLRQVCDQAGVTLPKIYFFIFTMMQHGWLLTGALVGGLIFLELRSDRWPRYRRAVFSLGVFVLNSAILVLISFLVAYSVIAAVQISHPAHQILFP